MFINRALPIAEDFLVKSANDLSRFMEKKFLLGQGGFCSDVLQSPIEDMFWLSCDVFMQATGIAYNDSLSGGIFVQPQIKVGKFVVDFVAKQVGIGPDTHLGPVIVELDGHDFHDRNKKERAYEKSRDRFFVKNGYRVVHYTGSEIYADPYKAAFEVLEMVGAFLDYGEAMYNKDDPLGFLHLE